MIDTARVGRLNHFLFFHLFHKLVLSSLLGLALPAVLCSQAGSPQDIQPSNVQALLQRARDVMGGTEAAGMLVHYHASASMTQNYQSDRMYPPFLDFFQEQE
jgi:hypothetical protein